MTTLERRRREQRARSIRLGVALVALVVVWVLASRGVV